MHGEGVIENLEVECMKDDLDHIQIRFDYGGERYRMRVGREVVTDAVEKLAQWLGGVNRRIAVNGYAKQRASD
jgi:hypothetical protein